MRFSSGSIDTLATHAGRDSFADLGVHAPPIDLSSTYPFPDLDQATAALDAFATRTEIGHLETALVFEHLRGGGPIWPE